METEQQLKNQIDMIIAKIQRNKRNLSEQALTHFVDLSDGLNPTQYIEKLNELAGTDVNTARDYIQNNTRLFDILDKGGIPPSRPVIISEHEDELVSHTRGYGQGKTPQDYLDEFNEFINNNMNEIAALKVVCTRPHELTRDSLKSLKLELDRHHFTEQQLNTAWRELKNEDIAADIISYVRRYALGSALISREERIKRAVDRLRKSHSFTKMELDWLVLIEKTLLAETVIDRETFDTGAFKTQGGFIRADKIFSGKLEAYLRELNEYLYDDGGKIA